MQRLRKWLWGTGGVPLLETASPRHNWSICIKTLSLCTLIGLLFYFWGLSEANIMSVYVLGILLISSAATTWVWGIVSAVVGVLLFNCLFAVPRFTLFFYDLQYSITTVMMLVASLIASYIATELRSQLDREKLQTQRSEILLETSQSLQQANGTWEMLTVAARQMQRLMNSTTILFPVEQGSFGPPVVERAPAPYTCSGQELEEDRRVLAQVFLAGGKAPAYYGADHAGCRAAYFPIQSNGAVYSVVGVLTGKESAISGFARNLIRAMLDEAALAIEKFLLHQTNEQIQREADAERMRSNLLRSVSHDLRTPLTSISGNADVLLSSADRIDADSRRQLYQNIRDDSEWLIDLVENLLFISRLEDGVMAISPQPELLQELIPEAVRYLEKRATDHRLTVELPEELVMVRADARMLIQLIVNLVDNAIKYTPAGSGITVRFFQRGGHAVIEVADTGQGLGEADKARVFEMFYTADNRVGDARRGMGIGLALCQAIAQAHGGAMYVEDNRPQGAVFGFTMKAEEVSLDGKYIGN